VCFASPRTNALSASSKAQTFPYLTVWAGGGDDEDQGKPEENLRPALQIIVHGPKARIPTRGIVDSGADESSLPIVFAGTLGIDLSECEHATCITAGGPTDQFTWGEMIEVQLQHMQNRRVPIKAVFVAGLGVVLLGRRDFFQAFRVTVDERVPKFTLEPYE
jgi:hypothetical protein